MVVYWSFSLKIGWGVPCLERGLQRRFWPPSASFVLDSLYDQDAKKPYKNYNELSAQSHVLLLGALSELRTVTLWESCFGFIFLSYYVFFLCLLFSYHDPMIHVQSCWRVMRREVQGSSTENRRPCQPLSQADNSYERRESRGDTRHHHT